MDFILLSLFFLFLVSTLMFLMTRGILLLDVASTSTSRLSVISAKKLEKVADYSLFVAVVSLVCLLLAGPVLLIGGGINAA